MMGYSTQVAVRFETGQTTVILAEGSAVTGRSSCLSDPVI